jgi:alpha-D-xyloside xylohydrolase
LAGQETHLASTALAPGAQVMNAYPLMNSQGIYDGQRLSAPGQRVFILTRSGFAGSQRTASAIWSGDITSTWSALQKQIPAGLNMSLSGIPYWTTDIGGYTMQRKFSDKSMKSEDAEEWRELNVRWFEFGTFCPLLRVHGELRHREMWELGDAGSPAYQAELLFDRLRYRLFPYLYSWAWKVTHAGATFMRPLVMDFPDDPQVRGLTDEYMFGDSLLVCPITHYKARSRQVYLPAGTWYDLWTGKAMKPGVQEVAAPLDRMPLFVKAGAILPIGPDLQYISEKPQDPITLYVYPGADGDFTLYEDDGTTYGYEKGKYSEIPIHWDDATKTLTTGSRSGSFEGMVKGFRVVIGVGRDFPVVPNQEAPAELRTYQGEKLSVPLVDHP